jgi:hypothetical protein
MKTGTTGCQSGGCGSMTAVFREHRISRRYLQYFLKYPLHGLAGGRGDEAFPGH